jgi:hypothetical protein
VRIQRADAVRAKLAELSISGRGRGRGREVGAASRAQEACTEMSRPPMVPEERDYEALADPLKELARES